MRTPAAIRSVTARIAALVLPARAIASTALPRSALLLSVLTFAGYAMGLVRDRMFARTFGAGPELDAYNAAFVLPELALDVLVAGGLVAPFVPVFTGLRAEAAETARAFGRAILTLAVGAMAVTSAILFVFAPQTVELIAPGFHGPQRDLYVDLFRIMCVTPVIFAASIVLGEILVAERRFLAYGLAPLLYNGGIVSGTFLLGDRIGIYGAAVGAVVGAVAHLAIRLAGIRRTSFRPRPGLAFRTQGVGEFLRLMVPKMASQPIEPLTFLYFTALASQLEAGSVSSISFARNFESVPVSLIGAAFAIAAFPQLSAAVAASDRDGFTRTFRTNLATIMVLTTAAGLGLFVLGGFVIQVFLGGGAFDDEDLARTTGVLAIFAFAVPLESVTHLLARALYATRNTALPTAASVAGFVATVLAADAFAPRYGLAAIPAGFAIGMAVKVGILAASLAPRIAAIGRPADPEWLAGMARLAPPPSPSRILRRRLVTVGLAVVAVGVALGAVRGAGEALSGATLQYAPEVTPWARVAAPVARSPEPRATVRPSATASARPRGSGKPSAAPSPTPRGPFAMDLYETGDYVGEFKDIWCLPAAMQTAMNVMDTGGDHTRATQERLFDLARSIAPAPDGAAEPEAWASGLTQLGYGNYEVRAAGSIRSAVRLVASHIRDTNRPAGLLVWRGAHSWVVSGFTATDDPAITDDFEVTALRIEDVWYPRFSTIWGYSRAPDALVPVERLPDDFLPWQRPRGSYPDKDGRFVIVLPVT